MVVVQFEKRVAKELLLGVFIVLGVFAGPVDWLD